MKRGHLVGLGVGAAVVALAVIAGQRSERSAWSRPGALVRPQNVLLVTIDTLRADRVGRGLTPNIDRLASRGVAFPGMRATAPLTLPSHVSLMTGTIPPVHGVRENGVVFDRKRPTIATIFREAGYRTGAFVGAYVLNRRFGLDDGFETYDDAVRRDPARAERLEAERPGAEVVDAAIAWLEATLLPSASAGLHGSPLAARPFFLWLHLYDPHAPYEPPQEFLERAGGQAYDGEVAYADAQLGRLLDLLASRDLIDSTIVVVTSDHGESLGEHGEQTHGMLLYDAAVRVPLVIAGVDVRTGSSVACHHEVGPGLLRLAGMADRIPEGMAAGEFGGSGATGVATPVECAAYSETQYPRRAGWHALTALADSRWKLILSSERELYDMQNDPGERRNVAGDHPTVANAMSAMLASMQPARDGRAQIAPEAAERLRALGYVGGSAAIVSDDPGAPNPAHVIGAWSEFERALGLLQSGNVREAVPLLKRLASQHPGAPVFHSTYAQALKESGAAHEAVAVYKAAVQKWPSDPSLFHDLAVAARAAGDVLEAVRAEQAALALDDTSAMAQNGLGLLHADAGRLQEAIAAFERATELDPTNASYWTNLGNARGGSGDRTRAESAYRKALEIDRDFPDALNGLGTLYVQVRRAGEAVPLFERALARDPNLHEARLNLGIAYQEDGQRQKAADTYRAILASAPASAQRERRAAAQLLRSLE